MKLSELTDNMDWLTGNLAEKLDPPASTLDIRALATANSLTPAQVRAALLLSTGASLSSTARAVKVSRPALSAWLDHHEGFKTLYYRLIEEERAELRQTMLMLSRLAVKALVSILTSPGAHPGATVRAAELILRAVRVIDIPEAEKSEPSLVVINRQPSSLGARAD